MLQKISGGTQILLFYSCLPRKRASFFPNKRGRGHSILKYKGSMKVEDGEDDRNVAMVANRWA